MTTINTNSVNTIINRALYSSSKNIKLSMQRLSSGMKINNADDDAAGLSLSTKINSNLQGLNVVKGNVQTGINYLQIGSSAVDSMITAAQRIRDLAVQSANGAYSSDERNSIQQEVSALSKEISQIKDSTTFSDKKIFGESQKFLKEINRMSKKEAEDNGYVTISSEEEFVNLIADNGANTAGKTFVLMDDIDLSKVSNYTPKINFAGTFDGNGYAIKNLNMTSSPSQYAGVFGTSTSSSTIKNVGVENVNLNIDRNYFRMGALLAYGEGTVQNCYSTGNISNNDVTNNEGGLIGDFSNGIVEDCYSTVNVYGFSSVGGLIASADSVWVQNCFATGNISGVSNAGGLIGDTIGSGNIQNCYTTGNVKIDGDSRGSAGGIVGNSTSIIKNCYSTGDITSSGGAGGITGSNNSTISNCYVTGIIAGKPFDSFSTGAITGYSSGSSNLSNCVWNMDTTGTNRANGEGRGTGTNNNGLASSEMSDPSQYTGWNNSVWDFSNGTPTLNFVKGLSQNRSNNTLSIQADSKNSDSSVIDIDTSVNLGNLTFDITSANSSRNTIEKIDKLIESLTSYQSKFGSNINRLSSVLDSTSLKTENLSAANSIIISTDIAKESSTLIKNQILQNTSSSLLTQSSNMHGALILSLLNLK